MKKAQDGKTVTNVDVANNNVIKKFADDKAARQATHEARNAEFNSMMATADNSIQSTIDTSNARYAKQEKNVAKKQYGGTYPTQPTAAVINDYSKKKPYGQPGGPSFMATTPAPTLKKGGPVKKKK